MNTRACLCLHVSILSVSICACAWRVTRCEAVVCEKLPSPARRHFKVRLNTHTPTLQNTPTVSPSPSSSTTPPCVSLWVLPPPQPPRPAYQMMICQPEQLSEQPSDILILPASLLSHSDAKFHIEYLYNLVKVEHWKIKRVRVRDLEWRQSEVISVVMW